MDSELSPVEILAREICDVCGHTPHEGHWKMHTQEAERYVTALELLGYRISRASLPSAQPSDVVEALANIEHEQWMQWAKSIVTSEAISAERKQRWFECFKPYHELTEEQKEQDRVWARKALSTMPNKHEKAVKVLREVLVDVCEDKYLLRDTTFLASNPPQNAAVWDIRNRLRGALATVDEILGD